MCAKILLCPSCKQGELTQESDTLLCLCCRASYPIRDGCPDLCIDEEPMISSLDAAACGRHLFIDENLRGWVSGKATAGYRRVKMVCAAFGWLWIPLLPFALIRPGVVLWSICAASFGVSLGIVFSHYEKLAYRFETNAALLLDAYERGQKSERNVQGNDTAAASEPESCCERSLQAKSRWVEWAVRQYVNPALQHDVLVIGCGGDIHRGAVMPYITREMNLTGIDICHSLVRQFSANPRSEAYIADCLSIPFRDEEFDAVSMTDVLEHLIAPVVGLREASRVLKKGGVAILTTNNRCVLDSRLIASPILLLLYLLSFAWDSLLPLPTIVASWMGGRFYHTEFSGCEIKRLARQSSFAIAEMRTYDFAWKKLEPLLIRIPLLRCMGAEWLIVLRKK